MEAVLLGCLWFFNFFCFVCTVLIYNQLSKAFFDSLAHRHKKMKNQTTMPVEIMSNKETKNLLFFYL